MRANYGQSLRKGLKQQNINVHFRPQHAIGNYIVDFVPHKKLIIELDGSQHIEQAEYDEERTRFLESKGYKVLRFWNNDVTNNMEAVLSVIWNTLHEDNVSK